jgi:hypothetical protein
MNTDAGCNRAAAGGTTSQLIPSNYTGHFALPVSDSILQITHHMSTVSSILLELELKSTEHTLLS